MRPFETKSNKELVTKIGKLQKQIDVYIKKIRYFEKKEKKSLQQDELSDDKRLEIIEAEVRKLSIAIEQSPSEIVITDVNGLIEYVNPQFEKSSGYSKKEVIGKNPNILKSGEMDNNIYKELWDNITAGKQWRGEIHNKKKGGERYWEYASISPIFDKSGNIINYIKVAEVITKRKRAEERLQKSEEKFRTIVEFTYDWEYWVDLQEKFIYVSPSCKRITGYSHEEFINNDNLLISIVHPEDIKFVKKHRHNVFRNGNISPIEFRIIAKDGTEKWIEHICQTVYDNKGNSLGIRGSNRDITERKAIQEKQKRLEKQIQEAQKKESLSVLAGGLAHDFNNILTVILGNAELLTHKVSVDNPIRNNIENIIKGALKATNLSNQMLAYSGKGHFIVEPLNINNILNNMNLIFKSVISKNVILNMNLAKEVLTINADATQIQQVIMNLVSNASEAIGNKSGLITISTGIMQASAQNIDKIIENDLPDGNYVYFEINDTGCGMDKETRDRIFEPFFTTKFTGRGLGLAAVLGVVRGHKGYMKIHSEQNNGTSIRVLFPYIPDISSMHKQELNYSYRETAIKSRRKTILFVDDEEDVRTLAEMVLKEKGFAVLLAKDGLDAVNIFNKHYTNIDLVILDLTMPNISGKEAAKRIWEKKSNTKIIISSGYNESEILSQFNEYNLEGFIQKPYSLVELCNKVYDVIGQVGEI